MGQVADEVRFAPVILAGGSGTRFWPRSRRARAKQVLALDGETTMIQQTLERLLPVAAERDVWVITNALLERVIAEQLPGVAAAHIVSEPVARNTAAACALTAFLLEAQGAAETVIGIFPSDHVVADIPRFAEVIRAGIKLAAAGENIVVLGVPPTRPETGYWIYRAGPRGGAGGRLDGECEAGQAIPREAGPAYGGAVSDGGKLCLERRDLSVECEDAGGGGTGACAGYGSDAGDDCGGVWHGGFREGVCGGVSEMREHLDRLCGAGAKVGEG